MSRRILQIIESLDRTAVAGQLLMVAQGLATQGWDVRVAALDGGGKLRPDFAAADVETWELRRRWPLDPIALIRLQRLVSRLRPDVIHAWDAAAARYATIIGRTAGRPRLVVGQHRIEPWQEARASWIDRLLVERAARVVTSSCQVKTWWYANGLTAEKLTVIPPAALPARPSDISREELLRELRLPADARLIGIIGPLVPDSGVKDLIWAADLLRVLHDSLRLLIIGDGPLRPQLEQYARLASDLNHVQFLGDRDDVWRIMPHLDVLWNASEPRGHAYGILEAMAAGVPVIASDTPFNRELVVENGTGYLIPLRERAGRATRARHTDRLFSDGELAARLAAASRKRVAEQFEPNRMVQQYLGVYRADTARDNHSLALARATVRVE